MVLCKEYIKTYLLTSKIHTELYKNETKSGERYVCIKEKEQNKIIHVDTRKIR